MQKWVVSIPDRLDLFLSLEGRMLSRGKAQQAIEAGHVLVNDDVVTKAATKLKPGDLVTVDDAAFVRADDGTIEPADLKLPVLYEDDACLVVDKPAGIAVHPGAGMLPGEKTILHGVAFLFAQRSLPFSSESVLVHRLDRETTGCLLIAKTPEAHRAMQEQFETRTVKKSYLALVAGIPTAPSAMIDAPIGRATGDRTKMAVLGAAATREAQTSYQTLGTGSVSGQLKCALLLCDLHTGRTHQIRVHLSTVGHPILGDDKYVSSLSERLSQEADIRQMCLHAWKLTFRSPADDAEHAVSSPLPAPFRHALKVVGIAEPG